MCLFGARVVVLFEIVLMLELRIHRVSASLEEVLVGLTLVLGLSPSRIVIPLLCAVCELADEDCLVMRMRGGAERSGKG